MILATLNSELMSPADGLFGLGGEMIKWLHRRYFITDSQTRQNILAACSTSLKVVKRPSDKRIGVSDDSGLFELQAGPAETKTPSRSSARTRYSGITPC